MAASTSYDHNKRYQYDVFLSFSGEDTRRSFVDHLNDALQGHGIHTFKDDERLQKGKEIKDELLKSIEDSRFCIIVFSRKYASSSWCLDELVKIMECHKTADQTAFPVFYDVEPTEVRKQSGSVGEAFAKHTNKVVVWKPLTRTVVRKAVARHTNKKLGRWRKALKDAANMCGWELKNTADGAQGYGGAGKTTLARAIFDKLSINFEGRSFVENVRESSKAPSLGLKKLQEQVLRDVLKDKGISVSSVHEGRNLIKRMLCGKKVLVVLDDVDHKDQLEALAGEPNWFNLGSRIIITKRDEQVLIAHKINTIKEVDLLSDEEAVRLFNRYAFREEIPTHEYEIQSLYQVVRYAAGLPLAIKVLGSFLCGKNKSEWKDALARLETIPLNESLKVLEISYESLEDDYKEIFLDVACYLRHWSKDSAIRMIEGCGFHAANGLRVLEQKSLIKIEREHIRMHDRIVEMGKNIVRREHPNEPNRHSRLWDQEEIEHVLSDSSGSEAALCICLDITPSVVLEALRNMKKLRCLIAYNEDSYNDDRGRIDEAPECFPNSLRYLYWYRYPHRCLPKTFEANNLVALEMRRSKIIQLWEGGKVMKKLKFLYLSYTRLRSLDLGLTPNLERLDLEYCSMLETLTVHGGCLKRLVYLNLDNCRKLRSLDVGLMPNLEWLNLEGCLELVQLYVHGGCHKSLVYLDISLCESLKSISFIEQLESLEILDLQYCPNLREIPNSICQLKCLKELNLGGCRRLENLPDELGNLNCLQLLDVSCTGITHLPNICKLKCLKKLVVNECKRLEKLPDELVDLNCLETLDVRGTTCITHLPQSIYSLKDLKYDPWRIK